ncbi:MAG: hypothetical protein VX874_00210 [Pseudomonadota bacterium]|nr:hypothetical protein [Pseudomonadota bacterium]
MNLSKDVHVFGPAEPNYFCTDHLRSPKPMEKWQRRVVRSARRAKWAAEKSTWYLMSNAAPELIRDYNPKAKIVILVREHYALVKSLHGELLKIGVETQPDLGKAWSDTLANPSRLDFANRAIPNYPETCRIGGHAERWIRVFGHDQVYLMEIGDLENAHGRTRTARFLELDDMPDRPAENLNVRGEASQAEALLPGPVGAGLHLLRSAHRTAKTLFSPKPPVRTQEQAGGKPEVSLARSQDAIEARITEFFANDIALLERLRDENNRHHAARASSPATGAIHQTVGVGGA